MQVPTCLDWTLFDLVQHLGEGRRSWAATVAAGPDAVAKSAPEGAPAMPREREALPAWLAASTQELLDALREAGPDHGCWTWWETSQSPQTCGAVARHQLQEITLHTYDAQMTVGTPQSQQLSDEVALDGVDEFLSTCCATSSAWPYKAGALGFHVTEGRSWRLSLDADGARPTCLPAPGTPSATAVVEGLDAPVVSARSTANELVLVIDGRIPLDAPKLNDDRRQIELLQTWDPGA